MNTRLKTLPKSEIKHRSRWFRVLLISFIFAFAVLTVFAKQYPYFPFDLYITREIQLISWPFFNTLMLKMTELGYVVKGSLLLLAACLGLIFLKKPQESLLLFISTTGAVILSGILKILVSRPRPDPSLINQLTSYQVADSFPSGHVLFMAGFAGYLLYFVQIYLPKGVLKFFIQPLLIILIVLMGMSRIYLGAHWFSDTLGSYIVGGLWLLLIISIRHRYIDFPGKKSK